MTISKNIWLKKLNLTAALDVELACSNVDFVVIVTLTNVYSTNCTNVAS